MRVFYGLKLITAWGVVKRVVDLRCVVIYLFDYKYKKYCDQYIGVNNKE
jgi:hypothetical protein